MDKKSEFSSTQITFRIIVSTASILTNRRYESEGSGAYSGESGDDDDEEEEEDEVDDVEPAEKNGKVPAAGTGSTNQRGKAPR
jgi:hypothetical protein